MPNAITIAGAHQVNLALSQLEAKIQKKVVRKGLRKAAKMVADESKLNLSKNRSVISGELRKGMKVRAMKRSRSQVGAQVMTTVAKHKDPKFGGAEVEFGTKRAKVKSFLRPALYENEMKVRDLIAESVMDAINGLPT